jgi:hypothetical protein
MLEILKKILGCLDGNLGFKKFSIQILKIPVDDPNAI